MNRRRRQPDKKKIAIISICAGLIIGFTGYALFSSPSTDRDEMRGIWIGYVDYKELGLCNKPENEFRNNVKSFLDKAKEYEINTVFFHVRSYDDAAWQSGTFKMSKYLWNKKTPIPYDPLEIMVELAHKEGMELHAWMNPYRVTKSLILDPGLDATDTRILTAVDEVLSGYQVDGIHFDDYFYHNTTTTGKAADKVEIAVKKKHVNDLVKKVYARSKEGERPVQFGISPQGNIGNCRAIGADVDTWLSKAGYVDYVAPQIYWTDQHSATWRDRMYSDTLDEWRKLNKNDADLYVGLAAYCTGIKSIEDPGWVKRSDNLSFQVKTLRDKRCDGYILFSSKDLYRKGAEKELNQLKKIKY